MNDDCPVPSRGPTLKGAGICLLILLACDLMLSGLVWLWFSLYWSGWVFGGVMAFWAIARVFNNEVEALVMTLIFCVFIGVMALLTSPNVAEFRKQQKNRNQSAPQEPAVQVPDSRAQ